MNSKLLIFASVFFIGLVPVLVLAANPLVYQPLVGIPGIGTSNTFGAYINALYGLSIAVAALMAVIKIIIAGVKYMLSDVVTSKQEAIGDIRGSLLGLGVVISAVLVLTIINPQLTKTEIFIDPSYAPQTNVPNSTVTPETPKTGNGYSYVTAGANKDFKGSCNVSSGFKYTLEAAGRYEVCYDPLPSDLRDELNNIFPITSFSFTELKAIFDRYQTAHRPRMITDPAKLTSIATAENSKTKVSADVLLAVEFKDRSSENPPVYMDWIDGANSKLMPVTCRKFQVAFTPTRVDYVGDAIKGYLACVRMP